MKRIVSILLVTVMALMGSQFTVFADGTDGTEAKPIYRVDIKNICTLLWAGEKPAFSVELDPTLEGVDVFSEKWIERNGKELTVSGSNIAVAGGEYKYELTLSAKEGFYFANDLKGVYYQGVEVEDYQMEYEIPPGNDNQTMIVRGKVNNIIAASPLKIDVGKLLALVTSGNYVGAVDFILDDGNHFSDNVDIDKENSKTTRVSDDKYSYELVLKTKEGFHFCNSLEFLYDEDKYGYIMDYDYSLSDNKHTLKIKGLAEKKQVEPQPEPSAPELKPGISVIDADTIITNLTSDKDPKGTVFSTLKFRSTAQTNDTIKLRWKKLSKAKMYVIYGNKCGSNNKPEKLAASIGNTLSVSKIDGKKLKKGTYYKFIIVAVNSKGKVVSASKFVHAATKGGKVGNYKSVKANVKKNTVRIKKGKSFALKAKAVRQSPKLTVKLHRKMAYKTTNSKIATVSAKGVIKARKKGTCYVYAYTQSGVYKKIKVVVK